MKLEQRTLVFVHNIAAILYLILKSPYLTSLYIYKNLKLLSFIVRLFISPTFKFALENMSTIWLCGLRSPHFLKNFERLTILVNKF